MNAAPTSTLVLAMAARAPDVADSTNAYLYFFDGNVASPVPYPASTQKYNMLADSWTSVMKVPSRRQAINGGGIEAAYGGAATVGTAIYAISSGASSPLTYVPYQGRVCATWGCGVNEAYETLMDSWTTKTSMPLGATRGTLVAAQGNRVFAFAASSSAYSGTTTYARKDVNKYDATTDKWTSCARALGSRARRCRCTCGLWCVFVCWGVQVGTCRSGSSLARSRSRAPWCTWRGEREKQRTIIPSSSNPLARPRRCRCTT